MSVLPIIVLEYLHVVEIGTIWIPFQQPIKNALSATNFNFALTETLIGEKILQ